MHLKVRLVYEFHPWIDQQWKKKYIVIYIHVFVYFFTCILCIYYKHEWVGIVDAKYYLFYISIIYLITATVKQQ